MRHSCHATGSEAAQTTLQALAGWTPSRRNVLGSLLTAGAAAAAVSSGVAIAFAAEEVSPTAVSPRMAELIAEFIRLTAILDETDFDTAPDAWNAAAEPRSSVL